MKSGKAADGRAIGSVVSCSTHRRRVSLAYQQCVKCCDKYEQANPVIIPWCLLSIIQEKLQFGFLRSTAKMLAGLTPKYQILSEYKASKGFPTMCILRIVKIADRKSSL
ncbi:MAG: hypothetical protein IPG64_00935 [Haliea sp.]|nr:hypothetical protein [Haliea sp.]